MGFLGQTHILLIGTPSPSVDHAYIDRYMGPEQGGTARLKEVEPAPRKRSPTQGSTAHPAEAESAPGKRRTEQGNTEQMHAVRNLQL